MREAHVDPMRYARLSGNTAPAASLTLEFETHAPVRVRCLVGVISAHCFRFTVPSLFRRTSAAHENAENKTTWKLEAKR